MLKKKDDYRVIITCNIWDTSHFPQTIVETFKDERYVYEIPQMLRYLFQRYPVPDYSVDFSIDRAVSCSLF